MKYIDADKLIAEIERRKKSIDECPFIEAEFGASIKRDAKIETFNELISIITPLQQEQSEVDLDREIIKYKVPFTDEREYLNETTLDAIARHFWNKGYNARKEESK